MEINFENVFFEKYLKGISFDAEPNTITALIGDNSKDCIGRLLIGLDKADSGNITIDQLQLEKSDLRKKVGCLFNNLKNYTFRNTVDEQLDQAFEYYEGLKKDKRKRKIEALKMVGLNQNYLTKNIFDLSLTEKKKIIFAATLIFNPEIIILDHFELHFNFEDQQKIKNILKKIKKKFNKTIVVITNNINFLLDFAEEYIVFNQGYIISKGNREILYQRDIKDTINVPEIIDFVWLLRDSGIEINNYYDIKELMKAIYREIN